MKRPLSRVGAGLATTVAGVAAYRYVLQPWHQTWGATEAEVHQPLPGDEYVPGPAYTTTRAITIEASPEEVWPWLLQLGQDRGGFYSYQWLENLFGLDIHNADQVVPEWQDLEVGDVVRFGPEDEGRDRTRMRVYELEPNRVLIFGPVADSPQDAEAAALTGAGTWAFVLDPVDDGATRLIVRTRSRPWAAPRSVFYLYDPVHFIMERKMLLGIKDRVESATAPSEVPPASDGGIPIPVSHP